MSAERPLSMQTFRVLNHFMQHEELASLCGADLLKELGLASGTLYPILLRLERDGLLDSCWEAEEATSLGRPRRRMYTITRDGAVKAAATATQLGLGPNLGLATS